MIYTSSVFCDKHVESSQKGCGVAVVLVVVAIAWHMAGQECCVC